MFALVDSSQREHQAVVALFRRLQDGWIVPGSILPEVDYLIAQRLGGSKQQIWMADLESGVYSVAWHKAADLQRAAWLNRHYRTLGLGYVDSMVIAVAERMGATAIATLDLRHFGSVAITGNPRLLPRDA